MKVIYVVSRLNNAVPINQLYSLLKWTSQKCECVVYTLFAENEDSKLEDFKKLNIKIKSFGISSKIGIFVMSNLINNMIVNEKPEIIHTEGLAADIVIRKAKKEFKWCSTLHNNIYSDYKLGLNAIKAFFYRKLHEICIRDMDMPICCSYSIMNEYKKHFKNKEFVAIQNGICVPDTTNIKKDYLKQYNGKTIIISVGSLVLRKNPEFIIENIKTWLQENNAILIILGEGKLMQSCREKANKNIVFEGKVKNVYDYLAAADIFVSASYSEGLPMAVIEAGCFGKKLVLSDIQAHKELSNNSNCCGMYFFETDNEKEFIRKLNESLNSSVNSNDIRNYFVNNYNENVMGEKYYNIYLEMQRRK